jgi:hypothetical protein
VPTLFQNFEIFADGFIGDIQYRRNFNSADVAGLVQMRKNLLLSFLREHDNPMTK